MPDAETRTADAEAMMSSSRSVTSNNLGIEDDVYRTLLAQQQGSLHPERYVLGKPHPDRARQFKPFAALRGYEELVAQVIEEANEPRDFAGLEESC